MAHDRIRYLPSLDGIRALAVLAVLAYHGDQSWAKGGYLGVDAFFVLSGFLITSLLLAEWRDSGRIHLAAFWVRRARRLLPALFLVLLGVALYAWLAANARELAQVRADGFASLFYFANWRSIFADQSYFDQFGVPSPLRHMWSLAIEEQFYLLWPLIVVGCLRLGRGSVRTLAVASGALGVGSVVTMLALYEPGRDPSRVYYGTDTRAASLLVGALLAMLLARRPAGRTVTGRRLLHGASLGAVVVLGIMWSRTSDASSFLYQGGLLLAAFLVAVVITDSTQESVGPVGWVLSRPVLRWIGTISYGLYLWHWPIYVVLDPTRTGLDGTGLFLLRVAVSFVVATASYYLVERPIRFRTWPRVPVARLAPVAAALVVAALVFSTVGATSAQVVVTARDLQAPTTDARDAAPDAPLPPRVMLVGDSLAASLAPGLAAAAEREGFEFWDASVHGCGFATEEGSHLIGDVWQPANPACAPTWRKRWGTQVAQYHPDVVLLLGGQSAYDRMIDGQVIKFDTVEGAALLRGELRDATDILSSTGAKVVLLTGLYGRLGWPLRIDVARSGFNDDWIDRWTAIQREVAGARSSTVSVVDLNAFLNPSGTWTETLEGFRARTDGVHLTFEAADLAARWLVPQILPARQPPARQPPARAPAPAGA